eukprot:15465996-Alexandrium_andersonii.AAC.1
MAARTKARARGNRLKLTCDWLGEENGLRWFNCSSNMLTGRARHPEINEQNNTWWNNTSP